MTILIDGSAVVAIVTHEAEAEHMVDRIRRHADRLCCSSGVWEAACGISRTRRVTGLEAGRASEDLWVDLGIRIIPLGEPESQLAIAAHDRYGKGTGHPARLNMGDCFAYACTNINNARLLYKGDHFSKTDLA